MNLTKRFLELKNACAEGYRAAIENNLIDNDYFDAIKWFVNQNDETLQSYGYWLDENIPNEEFVRTNGKEFTMGAYQLFNPMTGIHTRYETEAEVKQALLEVSKEILKKHTPTVIQEFSNENGDTAWIATKIQNNIIISV